jgi:hypothetical protein
MKGTHSLSIFKIKWVFRSLLSYLLFCCYRFLDITLTGRHNITSGKVYKDVISQERRGDYLGKTVQMVPHATDLVQNWLKEVAAISVDGTGASPDVCLIEVRCRSFLFSFNRSSNCILFQCYFSNKILFRVGGWNGG